MIDINRLCIWREEDNANREVVEGADFDVEILATALSPHSRLKEVLKMREALMALVLDLETTHEFAAVASRNRCIKRE